MSHLQQLSDPRHGGTTFTNCGGVIYTQLRSAVISRLYYCIISVVKFGGLIFVGDAWM